MRNFFTLGLLISVKQESLPFNRTIKSFFCPGLILKLIESTSVLNLMVLDLVSFPVVKTSSFNFGLIYQFDAGLPYS